MDLNSLTKLLLNWRPNKAAKKGRKMMKWLVVVAKDAVEHRVDIEELEEQARDKKKWKKLLTVL